MKAISLLLILPLLGAGCANRTVRDAPTGGVVIEYRDGKFSPSEIRVAPETTVTFKNTGQRPFWVASDVHPTHLICPRLNSLRPIGPGESYRTTFNEKKTCPFHNHLSATEIGRVVVE